MSSEWALCIRTKPSRLDYVQKPVDVSYLILTAYILLRYISTYVFLTDFVLVILFDCSQCDYFTYIVYPCFWILRVILLVKLNYIFWCYEIQQ